MAAIELDHVAIGTICASSAQAVPTMINTGYQMKSGVKETVEVVSTEITLSDVAPVRIDVDDLSIAYRHDAAAVSTAFNLFKKLRKGLGLSADEGSVHAQSISLLKNVTTHFPAGTLTAIIGSSGCGKTTLLNRIANRSTTSRLLSTGTINFNGSAEIAHIRSAYVMQQDMLQDVLTVRETLRYAADLRLPAAISRTAKDTLVDNIIRDLDLTACANSRIGSETHKGCSGGEKRRVSIGVQMLANPSVLFCDEPTTGLDAHSAFQTMKVLKSLAMNGRTVIASIHSPRSEIWTMFDNVILLSAGEVLYSGEAKHAVSYFTGHGHVMPASTNPAEFLIDLAAIDHRSDTAQAICQARIDNLKQDWIASAKAVVSLDNRVSSEGYAIATNTLNDKRRALGGQIITLTKRSTLLSLRDPFGIVATILEAVVLAVAVGWIYYRPGDDLSGIRTREGAVFTAATVQPYLIMLVELHRLSKEIQVFDRERAENAVSALGFLISRRLSSLLEDFLVPVVFATIFYFLVGLRAETVTFFVFLAINVILHFVALGMATVCVAVSRDPTTAAVICNLAFNIQVLASGYFVQSNQLPIWLRWIKHITYTWYSTGALISNEFIGIDGGSLGQTFACPNSNIDSAACLQYTGRFIVASMAFPSNWIWRPILILIGFGILHFLVAGTLLHFSKVSMAVAGENTRKTPVVKSVVAGVTTNTQIDPINVQLHDYGLNVHGKLRVKDTPAITLFEHVHAKFESGKINVIMGPSGCGKTSLLQSLAARLHSDMTSKYETFGRITFNDIEPSVDIIKSVASFVPQDDSALLSCLTVRETLRYAARLRLPSHLSSDETDRRAEEILQKMGLNDCAENYIGDNLRKGISGGQKRRVTMACQILTDPRVLLLDEPTSGLDAFLTTEVFGVLEGLAREGRTIIITIHQARTDLFKTFDNILLLRRGGSVAYSGPGNLMLRELEDHYGLLCPTTTNPADFALDLITEHPQYAEHVANVAVEKGHMLHWPSIHHHHHKHSRHDVRALHQPSELGILVRDMNPMLGTLSTLLRRQARSIGRDPGVIKARLVQVVAIGTILTLFFTPLQRNYESIQTHLGLLQQLAPLYFMGMLQNLAVYPTMRDVFYREHADHTYTATTFLLSYTALELPFTAASSLIFGVLISLATGLMRTPAGVFAMALNTFSIITCGESLSIIFCTLVESTDGFATNIMSACITIAGAMAGVMSLHLPAVLSAFNRLSPLRYMMRNLAPLALQGQTFSCSETQMVGGVCPLGTGEEVLQLYGLDGDIAVNIAAVVVCTVLYRLLAFGVLRVVKR